MLERIKEYLETLFQHFGIENFDNSKLKQMGFFIIVMSILFMILLLILGKYLWNNVLTQVIPAIKPVDSILQFIGLWFLIQLLVTK